MFEQFFDSVRKVIDLNVQFQQDLFKRWTTMIPAVPGTPSAAPWAEQIQKAQKKWAETLTELSKQQRETLEQQFAAGLKQIEEACRLTEIKDVEALRAKVLELWQKTHQLMQQANEASVRNFQTAVAKWAELMAPTT